MLDPAFHLILHDDERPVLHLALEVYRDDFGHEEHAVTAVADRVLHRLGAWAPGEPLALSEADMKVTWSALHSLLDDSRRDQPDDRERLRALIDRLPGEVDIALIDLDRALAQEA